MRRIGIDEASEPAMIYEEISSDSAFLAFLESIGPPIMRRKYDRPDEVAIIRTSSGMFIPIHTEVLEEMNGHNETQATND